MKRLMLATAALLAAVGGANAQYCSIIVKSGKVGPDGVPHYTITLTRPQTQFVHNANECAPFEASAVWAPGNPTPAPLGYCCYHNPTVR